MDEKQQEKFFERFKHVFENAIRVAESEVKEGSTGLDDIELQESLEDNLLNARRKVVKSGYAAADQLQKHISNYYWKELNYSKEEHWPTKWMLDDKEIKKTIDRYPKLIPVLNYIFNQTRHFKGEQYKEMIRLAGGKKYRHIDHDGMLIDSDYSAFVTNTEFYEKITKESGRKKIYIQKMIQQFCSSGILQKLGNDGRSRVYADGYFSPYDDTKRKISFLKKDSRFLKALRNFNLAN
jgi:hypothetical protein